MIRIARNSGLSKAKALELITPLRPEVAKSLAMALIVSSQAPLLLLDETLAVIGASSSFCHSFDVAPPGIDGVPLAELGDGEWNVPQLDALLRMTLAGGQTIGAYEMDLVRDGQPVRNLVVNAHKLDYSDEDNTRLVLAVTDVTAARLNEKLKDDLVREKQLLLQELQHRVANSLQIIASVLMQSARHVQSEETRAHLQNAHHRVMSLATLQKQLSVSRLAKVELKPYINDLCRSIGASMISDKNRLSLTTTVDDSVTSADTSVSIGLIVTELVINAMKHAFPGHKRSGSITVDYKSDAEAWALSVGDNGIGMSANMAGVKPGLGTGIVEALAKQLGATVVITDASPGMLVTVAHA